MTSASAGEAPATIYRIDMPCATAGFSRPPFDVHLRAFPAPAAGGDWTLLAHSSPGKADILARWLAGQTQMQNVRVAPGLAPQVFRATMTALPPVWSIAASSAKVHHLDLGADGMAAWFVECTNDHALDLKACLEPAGGPRGKASLVRCRRALTEWSTARLSRRQMEALSTAVAMGYYEIPHRIDLRTLAGAAGVSLGSVSELLRRAEATLLTHYVDASLMGGPLADANDLHSFSPLVNLLRG